ncbi:Phosphoethanolamine/phosphocholine phosphatase [Oopsacas minuta]|uniref:Phosphoethanolamine/phosphocholine phosphatase n=1 Tax=Oopsacas minuta TaxID=111878 RepID=A0AAV7JKV6_9METZ|nr:Phosphoethanolamine/phosphocholine phosphatase [Oopsacas minuta]
MAQSLPKRTLFAFDFDHTLIDDNTDTFILEITDDVNIICNLKTAFQSWRNSNLGWTECMRLLFKLMHSLSFSPELIVAHMEKIKIPEERLRILHFLSKQPDTELIIISDSNTVFIDSILKCHGVDKYFTRVYTNPAKFNTEGLLEIEAYHVNTSCPLSPPNMCKDLILREHISNSLVERSNLRVVYLGDGSGDFCAAKGLFMQDFVAARKGYSLASKLSPIQITGGIAVNIILSDFGEDLETFVHSLYT